MGPTWSSGLLKGSQWDQGEGQPYGSLIFQPPSCGIAVTRCVGISLNKVSLLFFFFPFLLINECPGDLHVVALDFFFWSMHLKSDW